MGIPDKVRHEEHSLRAWPKLLPSLKLLSLMLLSLEVTGTWGRYQPCSTFLRGTPKWSLTMRSQLGSCEPTQLLPRDTSVHPCQPSCSRGISLLFHPWFQSCGSAPITEQNLPEKQQSLWGLRDLPMS